MRAHQFISGVDHSKIGLDIKPDDPRYDLYRMAIAKYSNTSRSLSKALHALHRADNPKKVLSAWPKPRTTATVNQIRMLDDIMWNHPLKHQLTVYHGLKESPLRVWLTNGVPLDQSIRVHLPAYTSTSTQLQSARDFCHYDTDLKSLMAKRAPALLSTRYAKHIRYLNILRIELLPGMPALSIKSISTHPEENEVLLGRGVELEIQPNPQQIKLLSTMLWDCKVVYVNPREYWTD